MEEVVVVPECSPELKPVVGQKFQSLDFAFVFYDVYARVVGFDTRKQGMRKTDGVTTWYYVVCNREGSKKSNEDDQLNARSGFSMKCKRLSKRCGCKVSISFKFFSEGGLPGYIIQEFNEVHNHYMVESEHQHFMTLNRKLDDVHHKFILDCSKANIGHTLTFKVLKEMLMYCMIFAPFTGKDNHSRAVTFGAGLLSSEGRDSYSWLFGCFVRCMGVAPKMIITDQDWGMKLAVQQVLLQTRHRWCMWHIMVKASDKLPKSLLGSEDFKKEFNACVWSDLLKPDEFDIIWNDIMERYGLEDVH
ncbi:protein FAR1-RELATED SEQUENCE 5-like [Salvia splendens]|uniref:protein FAR1-RELATED SEQUENCE 5-like n=1 Tax=Salvia splendens TaxID=180675 RepID=UPI001C2722DE|nr:protein FAR1-RELATED SEQUENCE 5-like [Salvia splendens]